MGESAVGSTRSCGRISSATDWRANRLADALAKNVSQHYALDDKEAKLIQSAEHAVKHVCALMAAVTHAANSFKTEEVGKDGKTGRSPDASLLTRDHRALGLHRRKSLRCQTRGRTTSYLTPTPPLRCYCKELALAVSGPALSTTRGRPERRYAESRNGCLGWNAQPHWSLTSALPASLAKLRSPLQRGDTH